MPKINRKTNDAGGTAVLEKPESSAPALPADLATSVAELSKSRADLLDVAEKILLSRAPNVSDSVRHINVRLNFSADELAVFDLLGWDDNTLAREAARAETDRAMAITGRQRRAARRSPAGRH